MCKVRLASTPCHVEPNLPNKEPYGKKAMDYTRAASLAKGAHPCICPGSAGEEDRNIFQGHLQWVV